MSCEYIKFEFSIIKGVNRFRIHRRVRMYQFDIKLNRLEVHQKPMYTIGITEVFILVNLNKIIQKMQE